MASDLAGLIRAIADGSTPDADEIRAVLGDDAAAAEALIELGARADGLRQRGAELRSMMSSTRDLLSMPDADQMLPRIVDRAHELMDVDIAYLSVYEPIRDELYVRAVTGTTSPRFMGMVVPAGIGLASLAVRTRHPQWVEDYAVLTSVPHDPTIDEIVGEERIRSLLGAPLVVEDQVLGVLFAASREAHAFRPDEVALLSAFAGHAALVLHLAQLLKRATDATADAARRQREAEWAASLHGELTQLVVDGHDADAVVGALSEALGREVVFIDDPAGAAEPISGLPPGLREAARHAADTGRSAAPASGDIELVAPVTVSRTRTGFLLVARGEEPLTQIERRTVERSALTAALVTLRGTALAEAEERVRGEVAAEILEGPATRASGIRRAAARGYPVTGAWTLVVLPSAAEARARLLARLRARADWLVAAAPRGVTVLAPTGEDSSRAVAETVSGQALVGAEPVVFTAAETLDAAAAKTPDTWQVALLVRGLGVVDGIVDAAVLAPYSSLFGGDGERAAAFVEGMLGPVLEWDAVHGSALVDTLGALFDERWSLTGAARAVHVHVNTMKQRVHRLRELLGEGVDRPEERFRLELAVRIDRARRLVADAR